MKHVSGLDEPELKTLECAHRNHPVARVRNRAHVIILSSRGCQLGRIADICGMSRQAVSRVMEKWEKTGVRGLCDEPRPGRPRLLTPEDEDFVREIVREEPRSPAKVLAALEDERGRTVSKPTLRRVIRGERTWKRIRTSLKPKRNEAEFREKQEEISHLEQRREDGEIGVFYFDGAGFNETPCIPYAWQPKGEYIEIAPSKGQRLNVLAFMDKANNCTPFVFECSINTDVVIACLTTSPRKLRRKPSSSWTTRRFTRATTFWIPCPNGRRRDCMSCFCPHILPS
ncbi:IS630 family transposase [Desulfobacterales bacterium HSG2]|nr:IS630 family transposase [Desulfobacterales bacterium HSG2]